MDAMLDLMFIVDQRPASALDVYEAVHANRLERIQTAHDRIPGRLRNAAVKEEFRHLYIAMSNAIFDGYRVCFACEQPITFAHFSNEFSPDYPGRWKKAALGITFLTTLSGSILWFLAAAQMLGLPARVAPCQNDRHGPPVHDFVPPGFPDTVPVLQESG
jgi:hypothetical protein